MMSVLSVNAPKTVKSEYAFRIFDFDNDDMIGREDLRELINRLTAPQRITEMEMMVRPALLPRVASGGATWLCVRHILAFSSTQWCCNRVFF